MSQSAAQQTTMVRTGVTSSANVRIEFWHTLCAYKARLWANSYLVAPIPLTSSRTLSLAHSSKVRRIQWRVVLESSNFWKSHKHSEVTSRRHPRSIILTKACVASHSKRPQYKTQIQVRWCLRWIWLVIPSSSAHSRISTGPRRSQSELIGWLGCQTPLANRSDQTYYSICE